MVVEFSSEGGAFVFFTRINNCFIFFIKAGRNFPKTETVGLFPSEINYFTP
jgi:hypothetical protein